MKCINNLFKLSIFMVYAHSLAQAQDARLLTRLELECIGESLGIADPGVPINSLISGQLGTSFNDAGSFDTVISITKINSCESFRNTNFCDAAVFGGRCEKSERLGECALRHSAEPWPHRFVQVNIFNNNYESKIDINNLISIGESNNSDILWSLSVIRRIFSDKGDIIKKWPFVHDDFFGVKNKIKSIYASTDGDDKYFSAIFAISELKLISLEYREDGIARTYDFGEVVVD